MPRLSSKLIAIACAHRRIAWVHPFRDGNGRVVRLQSQAALLRRGLLESDSSKGAVRFGLPLEALAYYFPRLYPEAAA